MTTVRPGLWASGDAYDRYTGRWSARIAPLFVEWLSAPAGRAWLDVGCGTGVLGSAIVSSCAPTHVVGVDAAESFLEIARSRLADANVELRKGDAIALPVDDDDFDMAVSGLVLNFVSDPRKALAEMARVVRRDGLVALYVWDYAGHMQIMRSFFDAAEETDPRAVEFDDGVKAPICRPGPLAQLFEATGLADVEVREIDIAAPFADFDDYWTPFLGGTGSAPKYLASLAPDAQVVLREKLRGRLPTGPDGEILLAVRAWAAKGRVR